MYSYLELRKYEDNSVVLRIETTGQTQGEIHSQESSLYSSTNQKTMYIEEELTGSKLPILDRVIYRNSVIKWVGIGFSRIGKATENDRSKFTLISNNN